MQEDKAVRFKELRKIIPVSRSTIFRWENQNKFPKHFKLGKNLVAWSSSAIAIWLTERVKGE
jgi:prophage regulatory protein